MQIGWMAGAFVAGILHTVAGVDHYLPLIAIARGRRWSIRRTLKLTVFVGALHVAVAWGIASLMMTVWHDVGLFHRIDSWRASLAGSLLIISGVSYLLLSFRASRRSVNLSEQKLNHFGTSIIVAAFLVGPCEPLIPLAFVAKATGDEVLAFGMPFLFALATIVTMLFAVALGVMPRFERVRLAAQYSPIMVAMALVVSGFWLVAG